MSSTETPMATGSLARQKADFTSEGAPPPGKVSGLAAVDTDVTEPSPDVLTDASKTRIQIGVIVGSLRRDSYNLQLAKAMEKLAPPEFLFMHADIASLPLYNQEDDGHEEESVTRFKAVITSAQGLLFVTPEYNRSIPGVLKNAIDHGSRPYGASVWAGKPTGVIGISVGATGTAMAQQHLRNILAYLDVPLMGQPEAFIHAREGFFTENGEIGKSSLKFMTHWVSQFSDFVRNEYA